MNDRLWSPGSVPSIPTRGQATTSWSPSMESPDHKLASNGTRSGVAEGGGGAARRARRPHAIQRWCYFEAGAARKLGFPRRSCSERPTDHRARGAHVHARGGRAVWPTRPSYLPHGCGARRAPVSGRYDTTPRSEAIARRVTPATRCSSRQPEQPPDISSRSVGRALRALTRGHRVMDEAYAS